MSLSALPRVCVGGGAVEGGPRGAWPPGSCGFLRGCYLPEPHPWLPATGLPAAATWPINHAAAPCQAGSPRRAGRLEKEWAAATGGREGGREGSPQRRVVEAGGSGRASRGGDGGLGGAVSSHGARPAPGPGALAAWGGWQEMAAELPQGSRQPGPQHSRSSQHLGRGCWGEAGRPHPPPPSSFSIPASGEWTLGCLPGEVGLEVKMSERETPSRAPRPERPITARGLWVLLSFSASTVKTEKEEEEEKRERRTISCQYLNRNRVCT